MGKKDLSRLKSTLKKISKIDLQLPELEEKKKELKKTIKDKKSELKGMNLTLEEGKIKSISNKLTVKQLKKLLRGYNLPLSGTKAQLIQRLEEHDEELLDNLLLDQESVADSKKEIKRLNDQISILSNEAEYKEKKYVWKNWKSSIDVEEDTTAALMVAVVVITILLAISGRVADKEELERFYEEGFDCENGEIIHGSLVLNGVDDCSNGHDEKDPFWSTSDAQSYRSDAEDITLFGSACMGLICTPIFGWLLIEAGWIQNWRVGKNNRTLLVLEDDFNKKEAPVRQLKNKLTKEKHKLQLLEKAEAEMDYLSKSIPKSVAHVESLEAKLEETNMEIEQLKLDKEIYYDSIKSLIPYSYMLE